MIKEFEKIKNEVQNIRCNNEIQKSNNEIEEKNREELKKKTILQQIEKNKLILEKANIRQLFEEIKNSGLLKCSYNEPAIISEGSYESKYNRNCSDGKIITYISLFFNKSMVSVGEGDEEARYKDITIAVIDEKLHLSQEHKWDNIEYKPIEENTLETIIAREVSKYPQI